jgi:ATP-dependent Lon protease
MPARKGTPRSSGGARAPGGRARVPARATSAEKKVTPADRERAGRPRPAAPMGTPDLGSLAEGITPVLAVRQTVLFPFVILPLTVGRPNSVQLVSDVVAGDRTLAVFAQRDPSVDDPAPSDLHEIGTLATVLRLVRMPDEQLSIVVQGLARVRLVEPVKLEPYLKARLAPVAEIKTPGMEIEALSKNVLSVFERIVALSPQLPDEALTAARHQSSPARLADFIASLLDLPVPDKQRLLEIADVRARLEALHLILVHHQQVLELGARLQESVRETLDERQKEFLLRQQLEAIRKELGEGEQEELVELRERIEKAQMPLEVRKEADRELARLQRIPPQSPEYTVARTYLEWLCDMPWITTTEDQLDLTHVRTVLDEDHYGLDKIKERILEFLAVRRFKADARTPILCFVGPPGTGKTSLGMSIARALGRRFVRMSLGGVRDEAEIRGHRRTYIGALPGNIIRGIRRAGSRNPLFMLDEIDKLGADFRGDPASALLEVLDPAQNHAFVDHYLDVPFDLSQVLFVTTANVLDPIPPALRDRMEVIELTGYTDREKLEIAKRHLIPRAIAENGLESLGIVITDEAIAKVESDYTSEAGLRWLERELANLLRRTAKQVAEGKDPPRQIGPERVRELLGPERFLEEKAPRIEQPGAALGLAWTPYGGEVLTVEATAMPGSKQLQLTGQLGDVMRESAHAALSYLRTHAEALGVDPDFFEHADLHIHLPAGAIAKDGPSAGITMCAALASVLTGRKVRSGIGMTGEITLLGRVLPVGGLKEKVLAAHRAGLKTVILPKENEKDLEEVPVEARTRLIFAPVDRMDQVLALALEPAHEAAEADDRGGDGQDREEPGRPARVTEPALPRIGKPER